MVDTPEGEGPLPEGEGVLRERTHTFAAPVKQCGAAYEIILPPLLGMAANALQWADAQRRQGFFVAIFDDNGQVEAWPGAARQATVFVLKRGTGDTFLWAVWTETVSTLR